jgi:hypothetical protein
MESSGHLNVLAALLPQFPLARTLGGLQNRSERFGEERTLLTSAPDSSRSVCNPVTIQTVSDCGNYRDNDREMEV